MDTSLFQRFAPTIRSLTAEELNGAASLYSKMRLASSGKIEVCYVPFEYVNPQARIAIVGITPGKTQMINAIQETRRQLDSGASTEQTLRAAKQHGAFSGAMRPNLVNLLNHIGIQRWLSVASCDSLFGEHAHLVQTTSALRHPVFVDGENYNGAPKMTKHELLTEQLLEHFGAEVKALPNTFFIPLGDKVTEALDLLVERGLLDPTHVLSGLPHPSGANNERIAYFLGQGRASGPSKKTNVAKLNTARDRMQAQVQAFRQA